jgi:phage shock protein C
MPNRNRLTRSENRWILGVCGGIADFLGWSPKSVRALYILASVSSAGFPGIIAYLVLAWVMPPADRGGFHLEDFRA